MILIKLKLTGVTAKGKQRIKQAGTDIWQVLTVRDKVHFEMRPGPWWFIGPVDVENETSFTRWINSKDDRDFTYEIL